VNQILLRLRKRLNLYAEWSWHLVHQISWTIELIQIRPWWPQECKGMLSSPGKILLEFWTAILYPRTTWRHLLPWNKWPTSKAFEDRRRTNVKDKALLNNGYNCPSCEQLSIQDKQNGLINRAS
jgi:hypothetical protein